MDDKRAIITYGVEGYESIVKDIMPLLPVHHKELGPYQDAMPLAPDLTLYEKASKQHLVHFFTARDGYEKLIGYAIYFIKPNPHYNNTAPWAISDIFWLNPNYRGRGIGTSILRFAEDTLRKMGCFLMHTTTKVDHPALGKLLEKNDHKLVETSYQKRL